MEEDLYSDFVLLFRLLHSSRMPQKVEVGAESIIEKYHQDGLEAGSTIRNKLGNAVKDSIKALANGFINHPNNHALRQALLGGKLDPDEYYRQQLRIIYRLLFLFVIEERNLVYAESKGPETRRFNQIYFNYYSLLRLRKLAKKLPPPDASRHYDIWQSLLSTFALFENKEMGEKLGIMSLQGDLFGPGSIATNNYDLHDCLLSNALVLQIIKALSYFENEANMQIAVNYGGLDVEEFGSVYEGLLELKLDIKPVAGTDNYSCSFAGSEERSKSGSHYTPDELVQPLIKHSLDYLLEDRKKIISGIITKQKLTGPSFRTQREDLVKQHIYSLKVCDIACGSGHLLISGARRIAEVVACIIEEEEQPNPKAFQLAKRNAILNCIYGVDKNPLAVELCKVALWLEAYVPGQPLNFLDHHIKCGDSIVGLAHRDELENGIADEAFKTLPGDDKDIAKLYRDQNIRERKERIAKVTQLKAEFEKTTENSVQEAMTEYKTFSCLPETTNEEIERKAKAYKKFIAGKGFTFLKAMADTQIAQFFIPKVPENKDLLMTDGDFRQILSGYKGWQDRKVAKATAVAHENRFFHWFLEFPEVFQQGGFDCILGNPPFIAGRDIKQKVGEREQSFIFYYFSPCEGRSDIVAFFFRRNNDIINNGFLSLIATNTISQGETRTTGIEFIVNSGAQLNAAYKSIPWPGKAGVTVSLITLNKLRKITPVLNGKEVEFISTRLEAGSDIIEKQPFTLFTNKDLAFQGSIIYGEGFKISNTIAKDIISRDHKYLEVIKPFLTGDDLNDDFEQNPSETVINFYDWSIEKAAEFPLCLSIVESTVKLDRQKKGDIKAKEFWWIYLRNRIESYKEIEPLNFVLVNAVVSKYPCFVRKKPNIVFSNKNTIFKINDDKECILHSSIYNCWIFKYSTTLGASTINFSIDECFNNFPFPKNLLSNLNQYLRVISEQYHEYRRQLMIRLQLGLTKTYNAFHAREVQQGITSTALQAMDKKAIEKQYGKEVWNLWNHLQKTPGTCTIEEAIAGIVKLRELHVEMDNAVLDAYGWSNSGVSQSSVKGKAGIDLRHDFYEVDYLPENDRVRYTIHPDARKEILKRLLELNHKIHEEEVAAGLWEKKKPKEYKTKTSKTPEVKEPDGGYGDLFDLEN